MWSSLLIFSLLVAFSLGITSPPSGALIVSKDKAGAYRTVQSAVNAVRGSSPVVIFIYPGTYNEMVYITTSTPLTIYGYSSNDQDYKSNQVTISYSKSSPQAGGNDQSGVLRVHKNDFAIYNVNLINTYSAGGVNIAVALAASMYGQRQAMYGCKLVSWQDTLLVNEGTQYFSHTYIEGAVDYIWGQRARSYFEACTLASISRGYITANGRDSPSGPSLYVFNRCSVVAASGAKSGTVGNVYLGRPWREYATVVFMNSYLSNVLHPAGWSPWAKGQNPTKVTYLEYNNNGAGKWNSQRARFAKQASSSQIGGYSISSVLGSDYSRWANTKYAAGRPASAQENEGIEEGASTSSSDTTTDETTETTTLPGYAIGLLVLGSILVLQLLALVVIVIKRGN